MNFAKCACQHCNGPFEIPSDYLGHNHECPHCKRDTRIEEESKPKILPIPERAEPPQIDAVMPFSKSRGKYGGYTMLAAVGFIAGLLMIFGSMTEFDAKTVFQQIASRVLLIGGFALCGLSIAVEAITPVLRCLWDIANRLESIEARMARAESTAKSTAPH